MKQASAFEEDVFTHSDVKPGMVVKAKILSVDAFGAILQIPGGLKALCPLRHMSEFEISKPGKKFKVLSVIYFIVLLNFEFYSVKGCALHFITSL